MKKCNAPAVDGLSLYELRTQLHALLEASAPLFRQFLQIELSVVQEFEQELHARLSVERRGLGAVGATRRHHVGGFGDGRGQLLALLYDLRKR